MAGPIVTGVSIADRCLIIADLSGEVTMIRDSLRLLLTMTISKTF